MRPFLIILAVLAESGTPPVNAALPSAALSTEEHGNSNPPIINKRSDWARYSGIQDQVRFDVGNFPMTSEFGGGAVPITQGLVSTLVVPPNAKGGNAAMALSAYASSGSKSVGAVGLFGAGLATRDGVSAWGLNTITNNSSTSNPARNTGYDSATLYGYEANFNVRKAGGTAPAYALRGIYLVGDSDTAPSTGLRATLNAVDVESYGIYQTPALAWNIAFNTNDGAASSGVSLGALSKTAVDSGSQPIVLRSRSGGVLKAGTISTDPLGDVLINPAHGASTYLQSGGTTTVTVGSSGTVTLRAQTYAQLIICNSAVAGSMAYVTDIKLAVTSWHQPVSAGGGSNKAFVQCMGSGWVAF